MMRSSGSKPGAINMSADQLAAGHRANYWSEIKRSGIATSLLAGSVIVSSRMKILGTGVMVGMIVPRGMV